MSAIAFPYKPAQFHPKIHKIHIHSISNQQLQASKLHSNINGSIQHNDSPADHTVSCCEHWMDMDLLDSEEKGYE